MDEKERVLRLDRQFLALYTKGKSGSCSRKRAVMIKRGLEANEGYWTCTLCGGTFNDLSDVTIDHVVPLYFKQKKERHIVQLAHKSCNNDRQHMPVTYFFMFRKIKERFPEHIKDAFKAEGIANRIQREKKQRKKARRDQRRA